jgi:HlyD family secretion protein
MKAIWILVTIASLVVTSVGCSPKNDKDASQAQTQNQKASIAVDVEIANLGSLQPETEYTGTTAPIREVLVRSRLEGRLLDLKVDVGDRVVSGQAIAQLDDTVPSTAVLEANAEVAAREAEVSQANAAVGNARAEVERSRVQYQQAQADADRAAKLAKEGASSPQTAENAIMQARSAEQSLRAAEQQVKLQEQALGANSQRVLAQKAIRAREQERRSYTTITAPIDGVVLERISETGNLLLAGNEILRLGDFSQVKTIVQISELEISQVRLNQSVDVRFDTFPDRKIKGTVRRISPVADPVARLIPVEIVVPNQDGKLGSGQLARVRFSNRQARQILISETALESAGRPSQPPGEKTKDTPTNAKINPKNNASERSKPKTGIVFVITGDREEPKVAARQVELGDRRDGKVEILSGLKVGDRVVTRSGGKLQDGDSVRISVLSESTK